MPRRSPSHPGAAQAAVTLGNTDGEIAGLTVSEPPPQAEVQGLRDACEELADDVRALATLVYALPGGGALVAGSVWLARHLGRTGRSTGNEGESR